MNNEQRGLPLIAPTDVPLGWVESEPIEKYHEDWRALSSSAIRRDCKSAKTFRARWLKPPEEEERMRLGSLAHLAILEPKSFREKYVVMPEFVGMTKDGRPSAQSKEAKEKRAEWIASLPPGSIVVTEDELSRLTGMVEAVLAHETASQIIRTSLPEVTGYFVDKETGLYQKIRPDLLARNRLSVTELKTTGNVEAWSFAAEIVRMGYHIQLAAYSAGIQAIDGSLPKYQNIIAVEDKEPYEVAVYVLDDAVSGLGMGTYRQRIRMIAEAIRTGRFNGYQSQAQNIGAPGWALYDESLAV